MNHSIRQIVNRAVEEINVNLANKVPLDCDNVKLYGKNGFLDSLSLVNLIVVVEDYIEEEFGVGLILADEKAMSQANSPFATINSLVSHVKQLMEEKN